MHGPPAVGRSVFAPGVSKAPPTATAPPPVGVSMMPGLAPNNSPVGTAGQNTTPSRGTEETNSEGLKWKPGGRGGRTHAPRKETAKEKQAASGGKKRRPLQQAYEDGGDDDSGDGREPATEGGEFGGDQHSFVKRRDKARTRKEGPLQISDDSDDSETADNKNHRRPTRRRQPGSNDQDGGRGIDPSPQSRAQVLPVNVTQTTENYWRVEAGRLPSPAKNRAESLPSEEDVGYLDRCKWHAHHAMLFPHCRPAGKQKRPSKLAEVAQAARRQLAPAFHCTRAERVAHDQDKLFTWPELRHAITCWPYSASHGANRRWPLSRSSASPESEDPYAWARRRMPWTGCCTFGHLTRSGSSKWIPD